jgi:hypothetical protein
LLGFLSRHRAAPGCFHTGGCFHAVNGSVVSRGTTRPALGEIAFRGADD